MEQESQGYQFPTNFHWNKSVRGYTVPHSCTEAKWHSVNSKEERCTIITPTTDKDQIGDYTILGISKLKQNDKKSKFA